MRRKAAEVPEHIAHPDWAAVLDTALSHEGSTGDTYNRLYRYSMGNIALLMHQGVTPQPVANFGRWKELGRYPKRGSSAYYILRPITVKLEELDEEGEPKKLTKFKPVKSVFPLEMTEGEPLPEFEHPEWCKERALGALAIRQVTFQDFEGNAQGYSVGRDIAINPLAKYPDKTLMHELGHVVLGHTAPDQLAEYQTHRGIKEFEAEGTAHLVLNELDMLTPEMATVSRGYLQGWLKGEQPPEKSIRNVFKATDQILRAGREPVPPEQ